MGSALMTALYNLSILTSSFIVFALHCFMSNVFLNSFFQTEGSTEVIIRIEGMWVGRGIVTTVVRQGDVHSLIISRYP